MMSQRRIIFDKDSIESADRFSKCFDGLPDEFLGELLTMPSGMTALATSRFEVIRGSRSMKCTAAV
jgi:hypothetical protein